MGWRRRAALGLGALALAFTLFDARRASALPPPAAPLASPTISPSIQPTLGAILPVGAPLFFVLEQKISSGSTPAGTHVRLHLLSPMVLAGTTVAEAGAPLWLTVVSTRKAQAPDVDGAIEIHVDAMTLANGLGLPMRPPHDYLTLEFSAGHKSTAALEDMAKDIFIPYHSLYRLFRRGRNFELPAGTELRMLTAASVDAHDPGAVAIVTPAPLAIGVARPYAPFTPIALFTQGPQPQPVSKHRGRSSPTPSPSPTGTSSPDGSPTVPGSAQASSAPSPTGT